MKPAGFFVVRTPRHPFADFSDLAADGFEGRLRALCSDPEFREGLFFASPDVVAQADRWSELNEARSKRLTSTIYKYVSRMTTRPTPFGTFAGYSTGRIGARTNFASFEDAPLEKTVEISSGWLRDVMDALRDLPEVRDRSRWFPNPTARHVVDAIRYVQRYAEGRTYSFGLSEVDASPLILHALSLASGTSPDALAAAVVAHDPSVTPDEARLFVERLIDAQLLVSDFELPLSTEDPAADAVRLLRERGLHDVAAAIESTAASLAEISRAPLGTPASDYGACAERLRSVAAVDSEKPFNGKLLRRATPEIGPEILSAIEAAAAVLQRITPHDTPLAGFIRAFEGRYGSREVPLLEALDPETGVGFPPVVPDSSLLIDAIPFESRQAAASTWTEHDRVLLDLLCRTLERGSNELVLTDDDVARLEIDVEPLPLPDTFGVGCSVAARSEEDVRRGDFRLVFDSLSGPSAARVLSRFCATDPVLYGHVRQHIAEEERYRPGAIFAEVLHVLHGNLAVAATRPALRRYEIPLLAASSLPESQQIPCDDLLLRIEWDRVIMTSRRLRCEVIPRLTTAVNIDHPSSIGLHRFFGEMARQGRAPYLSWRWGRVGAAASHLPRVSWRNVVLTREAWRISEADEAAMSGGDHRIAAWCRDRRLPRFVRVRELVVDTATEIGRATLADLSRGGTVLIEVLPGPEELWVGGERPYMHELIIPYTSSAAPVPHRAAPAPATDALRTYVPGTEWLYAQLYTGPSTSDRLLAGPIAEVIESLRRERAIDCWFFIRFADPEWHLRIRFHGDAVAMTSIVLPRLRDALQPYVASNAVARFDLSTYEPEIERYGGPYGSDLAERIFEADSDFVVALLSVSDDPDERSRCTIAGIDRLLSDAGFDFETKRRIIRSMRDAHSRHFRSGKALTRSLGDRYRQLRPEVEGALHGATSAEIENLLRVRSERLAPLFRELRAREASGLLTLPVTAIAPSLIHMFINRVLRGSHQRHELVIYDFLDRTYESIAMRSRAGEPRTPVGAK